MSSYVSDFFGRVWKLFKKEGGNRTSSPVCAAPLRRCNSVILDSRLKEEIVSHTTDSSDLWRSVPKWYQGPHIEIGPVTSRVFHSPPPEKKRECSSCKGDMNDVQHVLAFCEKHIPIRGRRAEKGGGNNTLRRSRSFDSRDGFAAFNRNTDTWHKKFHSLSSKDALEKSEISLNPRKEDARRQKSIFSVVDIPGKKGERKRSKSKIPVFTRESRTTRKGEDSEVRRHSLGNTGTTISASHQQMALCTIARRSTLVNAFDRLFWRHCDSKYRSNIIDCSSHCRWMREAGLELDTDGNRFRKHAKGKVTLNLNEYKCAVKKMCDEAGSNYWEVLDRMTSCHEGDSSLTVPSKKISM